jgi:4-aminobutyrate aminotransferase-like enzyme
MSSDSLLARRERFLGAGAELFYDKPIQLVRGEGAYLFDENGNRYIDFYNNVPSVGHGNPVVAEAIYNQQRLLNVHSRYLSEGVVRYAERLAAIHDPAIESFVFSCTGTEANEIAIQIARLATGNRGILCTNAAYHGSSDLVGRLTNIGDHQPPESEIQAFPFPDMFRPIQPGLSQAELGDAYLARIRQAIEKLEASGAGVAALLACSIFANEGLPDLPDDFMSRVAELVQSAGGLMIADEVQAGFGRTGEWWGYQSVGFRPDIVTMGKPMGNGVPVSGTGASRALIEHFRAATDHFNTFASSPLQAAAGMAVLDVMEQGKLLENARRVGETLKDGLTRITRDYSCVGEVRGRGLFVVVEIVADGTNNPDPVKAAAMSDLLKDLGFLTAAAGAYKNLVKVRPPLVVSNDDAEALIEAFKRVLEETHA